MRHHLREDALLDRSHLLVERAGPKASAFRHRLARRLGRSKLRGLRTEVMDVAVGGWLSPARPMVVAEIDGYGDVRCYIGAEAAGIHLEVVRYVAVEPSWVKRLLASVLLRGRWWGWSLPRQARGEERVATFLGVVDAGITEVLKRYVARRGAGDLAMPEGGDVLDRWQ